MFYGHRRKGLYTRKAQLAYLGSPYKMEKVYAKAFHGFLKPYFFGSHGASDAQLRR